MTSRRKRKTPVISLNLILSLGGILISLFFGYLSYRIYQSDRNLISLMIFPLIFGIIFENKRLSTNWKIMALKILGALLFSILAFIPNKHEHPYDFENHIEVWPYWFVIIFVIISMIFHDKKIIPKLTEGITLLQSISIIYWIIDIGFLNIKNTFTYVLISIGVIFCIVSFIHAFSYIKLTRNARLFLSIWSSIIMIIFAIDHIYRVYNFDYFMDNAILNNGLNILQYFLLGVSLIYIFQNAFMLLTYLPDKHSFYGKSHMKEIKNMNKTHIKRYSMSQIKISDSFLALLFTSLIYFCNYSYKIIPRHTLIWLIFWTFPILIWTKQRFLEKRKTTANTV